MNRSLATHLTIVFAKARPIRSFAVVVAMTIAAVTTLLISAQSFQQSAIQQAQSSTGRADYILTVPDSEPVGETFGISEREITTAMRAAGASDPRVGIESYQVPIDRHEPLWMNLTEHDWAGDPFPERYVLSSGRLPAAPGEVTVSQALYDAVGGGQISLAGGALTLDIVGVVRDETNREAPVGMVAPGTWGGAVPASGGYQVSATRIYYWESKEAPEAVVRALSARLSSAAVAQPPAEDLSLSVVARQDFTGGKLYSELAVTLLIVPQVVGVIGGWAGGRFVRRIRETLMQIGVARTLVPAGTAIMGSALMGSLIGVGIGVGSGVALRPLLDTVSNRTLGPIYGLESFVMVMIGALLLGTGLGTLSIMKDRTRHSPRSLRELITFSRVLPSLGLILILAGVFSGQNEDLNIRLLSPFFFGAAVVIAAPLVLQLARRLESESLPTTLALRLLTSNRKIAAWTTIGIAMVLMLSFSTLLLNYSVVTTANAHDVARVAPGHIQLAPPAQSEEQFASLQDDVEEYAGVSDPVMLTTADASPSSVDGPVMIVEGPDDAERLLGVSLSAAEAASMEQGSLIRYTSPVVKEQLLRLADAEPVTIPVEQLAEAVSTYKTFAGLITRDTAKRLQIPEGPTVWVYTNMTDEQAGRLADSPGAVGFDPRWLIEYEAPAKRSEPPVTLLMAFASGLIASVLVTYFASASTRSLRPILAALQALGVRSRWLIIVSTTQLALVALTALIFAFLGAIAATFLSTQTWLQGARLHIPWGSVGLLVGTFVVGVIAAQILAKRRLSASER